MPTKVEPMDVPDEKIVELRQLFFEKLEREGHKVPGGLHPDDLSRIQNRKKWLLRFLEYNDLNLKISLDQLWNTCVWRKNNNVNDTNENCIHLDLIKAGLMFHRNEDVDGKRLLVFKTKMYVRGTHNINDMKKNLIYYVERMYRETDMDQITAVFDMQDSGMSNVDIEYTRYIINLFKHYYPNSLNFILVFELPWVLTATFKIIKGLLPPKAVERLRFVSKKNIHEYIAREKMLTCWGGTDDYEFEFTFQDPAAKILARDPEDDGNNNSVQSLNRNGIGSRKVHFAPTNMSPIESPMSDQPPSQFKDDKRLHVVEEGVIFTRKGADAQGSVRIRNISTEAVLFKVKTTSPEKFRVSPPAGLIKPGQLERITVTMVHGHGEESARDKFLIMCKPLGEDDSDELMPIDRIHKEFKQADSNDIEQHRVRCIYACVDGEGNPVVSQAYSMEGERKAGFRNGMTTMKFSTSDNRDSNEIADLYNTVQRLERQVSRVQTLQYVLLAVCFLLIALIVIYVPKFESVNPSTGGDASSMMNEQNTLPGMGI